MTEGPQNSACCTGPTFPVSPGTSTLLGLHSPCSPCPLPFCALSPRAHATVAAPHPMQGPGAATYISKTSFLEGRKKRGQCQWGNKMSPETAQHLPMGQGLPQGTQGGHRRLQGAIVTSILAAPSGHRSRAPTAPPQTLLPPQHHCFFPHSLGGRSGAHVPGSVAHGSLVSRFQFPKFPWQLSPCLQPAQPPAAAGSERHRGHQWGPQACCGQGTARLSTVSSTQHVRAQPGSRESWGIE